MQNTPRNARQLASAEALRRFASGESAAPPDALPVAFIPAARCSQFGLPGNAQAVVIISRETVSTKKHRKRFVKFGAEDWRRVQRILNEGRVLLQRNGNYSVAAKLGSKNWVVVLRPWPDGRMAIWTYYEASKNYIRNVLPKKAAQAGEGPVPPAGPFPHKGK